MTRYRVTGVLGVLVSASLWLGGLGCASGPAAPDLEQAKALLAEGREAAHKGRHEEAISLYSRAIEEYPDLAEAWHARGNARVHMRLSPEATGDIRQHEERALEDYTMAVSKDPTLADAYFNRAMVLASRALYKPAIEDLLLSARYKPRDPEPHYYLGKLYEEKFEDRGLSAMEHYEKYAELGGTDAAVREKVKLWKEFKKQMAPAPATGPDAEKAAEELDRSFRQDLAAGKWPEAQKKLEDLLSKYGQTQFVQRQAAQLNAVLKALQAKKEPPK